MRWFWIDRFTEFVSGSHADGREGRVAGRGSSARASRRLPGDAELAGDRGHRPGGRAARSASITGSASWSCWPSCRRRSSPAGRGPGRRLTYRVKADWIRNDSAQVSGMAYDRRSAARRGADSVRPDGRGNGPADGRSSCFGPRDLRHWLNLVGVFEVGVKQDGTRLKRGDYPLDEDAVDGES